MSILLTSFILTQITVPHFAECTFDTHGSETPYSVDVDCGIIGSGTAKLTESGKYFYGEIATHIANAEVGRKLLLVIPKRAGSAPHSWDTQCWDKGPKVICSDPEALRETYWGFAPR